MKKNVKTALIICICVGAAIVVGIVAGRKWYNSDAQKERRREAQLEVQRQVFDNYLTDLRGQIPEDVKDDFLEVYNSFDGDDSKVDVKSTETVLKSGSSYTWHSSTKVEISAQPDVYALYFDEYDEQAMMLMEWFADTVSESVDDATESVGEKYISGVKPDRHPLDYHFANWREDPSGAACFNKKLTYDQVCRVVLKRNGRRYQINRTGPEEYTYYIDGVKQDMDAIENGTATEPDPDTSENDDSHSANSSSSTSDTGYGGGSFHIAPTTGASGSGSTGSGTGNSGSNSGGYSSTNGGNSSYSGRYSGRNYSSKTEDDSKYTDNPNGYDMRNYSDGYDLYDDYEDDFEDEEEAEDYYDDYGY